MPLTVPDASHSDSVRVDVPPGDELVAVVNAHDNVVGVKLRSELLPSDSTRVVNAFIQRPDSAVWLPVRSASRRRFPGCLDFSVAGVVRYGEEYEDSLRRELREDVFLNLSAHPHQWVSHLTPSDGVSDHMDVFVVRVPRVEAWDKKRFPEAFWVFPSDLLRFVKHQQSKPDLLPTIERVIPLLSA